VLSTLSRARQAQQSQVSLVYTISLKIDSLSEFEK